MRRIVQALFAIYFLVNVGVSAEPKPSRPSKETNTSVSSCLAEMLEREASGMQVDRRALLYKGVVESAADHWQLGEIKQGDNWSGMEKLSFIENHSGILAGYEELRAEAKLDETRHRTLARWCQAQQLVPQEKAHWYGVLSTSPEDFEARHALKHQRVGDHWFTEEEIKLASASSARMEKEWQKWIPEMRRVVQMLQSPNAKAKQAGIEKLNSIDDATAISSLELACFQVGEDYSLPFLKAIARMRSREACLALARISIEFPIDSRGELAIAELKKYPPEMYVPELLSLLSTPVKNEVKCTFNAKGDMLIRSAMYRETMDEKQLTRIERLVNIVPQRRVVRTRITDWVPVLSQSGANFNEQLRASGEVNIVDPATIDTARKNSLESELSRSSYVNEINAKSESSHKAIYHVLKQATSAAVEDAPTAWWKWWEESNYVYAPRKAMREKAYSENTPVYATKVVSVVSDCLIRGTVVQTSNGLKPIETIQIGDLVASQNVETGELALKPVLSTTIRPLKNTIRISTDTGETQASNGHRWFVSGKGWLMTTQLEPDMLIRSATGTSKIKDVCHVDDELETYNLVIDDFHTYFVGEERLLSYDNSAPNATLRPVPGYGQIVIK